MYQKRIKCGHCQQLTDVAFNYVSELREPRQYDDPRFQSRTIPQGDNDGPTVTGYAMGCCPLCLKPNMFIFQTKTRFLNAIEKNLKEDAPLFGANSLITVTHTYPQPVKAMMGQHWPEKLKPMFSDAQLMLAEKKTPAMIVSACRSVLEVAAKDLGAEGKNLAQRIDNLADTGLITVAMKDWSHRVRIAGNEAVHEIEATHDEAAQLIQFITHFLDMAFTIPKSLPAAKMRGS